MSEMRLRSLEPSDWPAVRAIYAEGIATGNATFETAAPAWDAWDRDHLAEGRLVATGKGGEVVGWAALGAASNRCVYRGVAEVSVYVAERARGRGVGRALLEALVESSELAGIWTLQAQIMAENQASIALHERAGFRRVGLRERLGRLDGRWRDVVLLERRSETVGIEPLDGN